MRNWESTQDVCLVYRIFCLIDLNPSLGTARSRDGSAVDDNGSVVNTKWWQRNSFHLFLLTRAPQTSNLLLKTVLRDVVININKSVRLTCGHVPPEIPMLKDFSYKQLTNLQLTSLQLTY